MKPVLIIGAGISGLSTAFWLRKKSIPVEVIEKSDRVGGLISSERTSFGLIETAANGFLAADDILEICNEVGVELARRKRSRKKRYIFRKRPRRWPLTFKETWQLITHFFKLLFSGKGFFEIGEYETVAQWVEKRLGKPILDWLIAPALQGVYAGNADRMSARLILGGFRKRKSKRSKLKGTLAPKNGMGELIEKLDRWLEQDGVVIRKQTEDFDLDRYSNVVIATSSFDLNTLKIPSDVEFPSLKVESLPLVSATLFYDPASTDIEGFGCLFPRKEGFYSLGVLFNTSVFEDRSELRSETWILGGAFHKDVCRFSDEEILRQIKEDRLRLYGLKDHALLKHFQITRWEKALPHLSVDLEKQLENLTLPEGVFLTGNYLGRIGLSQIVGRNKELAERIYQNLKLEQMLEK